MQNPKDNLIRTLKREGFDYVPIDPNAFCPSQIEAFKKRFGHDDYYSFFNSPVRMLSSALKQNFTDWQEKYYKHETLPKNISFDAFGVGHSRQPDCFHMTRMHHPLKGDDISIKDIEDYPLPDIDKSSLDSAQEKIQDIHKSGLAAMYCMACTIWEKSWYIRSMEDLMTDMMTDDSRAECILDRITDFSVKQGKSAAMIDSDIIQLGDDIGMQSTIMMSIDLWRKWLKPRLARVICEIRKIKPDVLIFYHSCGYVLPFLEEFAEIGIDILNPVQPESMNFEEVHKRIGKKLSFWGTIGTQSVLPFGKPEDVRQQVIRNLNICGDKGGIVIGPTHMVEPEVPWENLLAMKEAAESYRK